MSSIGILENPLSCYSSESAGCLYSNSRQVVNVSAETTSIISHTDNSGKGRVLLPPIVSQLIPPLILSQLWISSKKTIFSVLTEVLMKTLTFMGTQLHEHSKC